MVALTIPDLGWSELILYPRLSQSPFQLAGKLVVRRETDFSHLQRAIFTDQFSGRRCVGGVSEALSNQRTVYTMTYFSSNLILCNLSIALEVFSRQQYAN